MVHALYTVFNFSRCNSGDFNLLKISPESKNILIRMAEKNYELCSQKPRQKNSHKLQSRDECGQSTKIRNVARLVRK